MLDDVNILKHGDPSGLLAVVATQYQQTEFDAKVINGDHDNRPITSVVVAGMGGSAAAALLAKSWLGSEINIPLEIIRTYDLPAYVGLNTLVIASSYSGNTEETVSCLKQAEAKGAQLAIITAGGQLAYQAKNSQIAHVILPTDFQPRMAVIYNLRALVALLSNFDLTSHDKLDEISNASEWLKNECTAWLANSVTRNNYAKQLALKTVGKTAVFYGGTLTAPVAYKWKISLNENAKNVAFWNELPEFSHNEFIGWTSHPVEKPFAIFDIISNLEHPQILKRFDISDCLLSGQRPKSTVVNLAGASLIEQLLWGSILADFVSVYLAILNGVNPAPVGLVDKLKSELA